MLNNMAHFCHTADTILSWLHQELLTAVPIFLGLDAPSLQNWFPRFKDNVDISALETVINVLLKHWEPIIQRHNVTYQNNGYLNYPTVKPLKTENFGANGTGVLYRNKLNNLPKIKFL